MAKKYLVSVDPAAGADTTVMVETESGQVVDVQAMPERSPMAVPEGGWPADEFTGESGRFVRDPFTGVRSRAAE